MMIPRLCSESSRWASRALPVVLLGLMGPFPLLGCRPAGPPPAPASSFELTAQQAAAVESVLLQAAVGTPRNPVVPLDLYPPDGIRWETLEDAVNHAVGVPSLEMSVTGTEQPSSHEQVFYLVDAYSWPARVTVRGVGDPMRIQVEAVMGPIPGHPISLRKAAEIKSRVSAAIEKYARVPRLAPYEIRTTAAEPGPAKSR